MATLRKITLNWEIRTGAITCDTGYIKRQELCDVDLYVTVDGTAYALDTSWALNLSIKPTLLGDNAALIAVTTWTASATTGLYQATAQTMGGAALDTYLAANNSDTTDDEGNKLVDLDVYYTISTAVKSKSDTVTLILKPDVGRADDTVPATIIARNDFLVSNGTGLLVNVAAGYAANGAFVAAQASLAITNATNYIEVTAAGVASVNTTAFTAGSYPLATVVASAGAITANTDLRAWITPKPGAAGGVTSITGTANEITVTGTTTPTLSLPSALTFTGKTVTGGTFASPSLTTPTIGDGTEAAPSLSFTSDTNTGVYRPAADTVGIVGGGNDVVRLTGIASATDYLEIKNGIGVGSPLHVLAEGASANIGVHLQPKGSGLFTISDGTDFNKGIRFRCSSSAASAITLLDAVSTAGRVITLPDATGTLALVSGDLGTPSALVGTNITGTASGLTAGNAALAATVTVANEATDTSCFPLFATAATGSLAALSNAGLTFNSATGLLSATLLRADTVSDNAVTGVSSADGTGVVGQTVSGVAFSASASGSGGAFSGYSFSGKLLSLSGDAGENFVVANNGQLALGGSGPSGIIVLKGSTSGSATITVSATGVLALPTGTTATNMTLTTPDLGTPSALVGTNITGMNASNISSGTLADARLSANVPLKDAANTFTAANTISTAGATSLPAMKFSGVPFAGTGTTSFPLVYINDANATASTTLNTAGTYFGVNGDGTQDLMNLLKDGTSQFKVTSTGNVTAANNITSGANISGANVAATNALTASTVVVGGSFGLYSASAGVAEINNGVLGTLRDLNVRNFSASGTLAVTGATTLSAALITTPEALAPALNAGAACGVTKVATGFALNGVNALTLANGTNGQIKTIVCTAVTAAGTATLTPTTCSGFTTVAFTAAGQTLTLQYFTTGGWVILSVRGATPA